jgi:uncharacterized protein
MSELFRAHSLTTGIGLRTTHYHEIINNQPKITWLEVHSENYFGKGGKPLDYLTQIHQRYPLSFHGVGLSLGSTDPLNLLHLKQLKKLTDQFNPVFVSEHLSWSSIDGDYLHDLLPLPYTEEALSLCIDKINQIQNFLNRKILIENISSYLQFTDNTMPEYEFISKIVAQTGCGILLDLTNLYINSVNHHLDIALYLQHIPTHAIDEIHLAGFTTNHFENGFMLIDTHDQTIDVNVWELYTHVIKRFGQKPTLIEWDKNIPELSTLLAEAEKANDILLNVQTEPTNFTKNDYILT